MARTKKYEDNSFKKLVKAIDEKWGHTYLDVPQETTIDDLLTEIRQMESETILRKIEGK